MRESIVIGDELTFDPKMGRFERAYIRIFGVPINGLRIRLRRVLPMVSGNPGKILDAGCGRGVFSYRLAGRFPDAAVVGVDVDEEQLSTNRRIARRCGLGNLSFEKMDVAKLAYADEFDLVLSVDNLEHIEDDRMALRHMAGALKKGGVMVLHVPGRERRWLFFRFRENFKVPGHFRPGYALEEIRQKVQSEGLEVVLAQYTYGWLETITNNFSYLITRAEARHKFFYALAFPLLNCIAWFGRNSKPAKGAGVLLMARKPL